MSSDVAKGRCRMRVVWETREWGEMVSLTVSASYQHACGMSSLPQKPLHRPSILSGSYQHAMSTCGRGSTTKEISNAQSSHAYHEDKESEAVRHVPTSDYLLHLLLLSTAD